MDRVSLRFQEAELCGFIGDDGCGKGLLLNVLGLLEAPDSGSVQVVGSEAPPPSSPERTKLRNEVFGFVFSNPALLPAFSVAENVAMPLFRIRGVDPEAAELRTREVLDFCGITELGDFLAGRLPPELAAKAALARALVHGPRLLVAVSPKCGETLLPLARRAAEELGMCVLWAGPADGVSRHAHRTVAMRHGRISPHGMLT